MTSNNNHPYYRSIRYRTNSTHTHPHSTHTRPPPPRTQLTQHTQIIESNFKPSSNTTKSIIKKRYYTMENEEAVSPAKLKANPSYMETFHTLLKIGQGKSIELNDMRNDRVYLPTLAHFQNSKFTVLDPINLPIQNIQIQIQKTTNGLTEQPLGQIRQMRKQLKEVECRLISVLQRDEGEMRVKLLELRQLLRVDKVQWQECKMRLKRECVLLSVVDKDICLGMEGCKQRIDGVQVSIFANRPFQLDYNVNYKQQFPCHYF